MSLFVVNSPFNKIPKFTLSDSWFVVPAVVLFVALTLAISRAFNTTDLSAPHRVFLWMIICGLIAVQVLGFSQLAKALISKRLPYVEILTALIALGITIPLVALQMHGLKFTPILPKQPDPPLEFLVFVAPPVAVIGGLFLFIQYLQERAIGDSTLDGNDQEQQFSGDEQGESQNTAADPGKPNTKRIQVEDHYLRIYKESGSIYVRGKLAEEISLLPADKGIQVHRSHWVAFTHIEKLVKEGRDHRLLLVDGDSIPVSRGRLAMVRKMIELNQAV